MQIGRNRRACLSNRAWIAPAQACPIEPTSSCLSRDELLKRHIAVAWSTSTRIENHRRASASQTVDNERTPADVDSLPSSLDSRLSQLRRLDASIGLTLVTARWPNLSRLHALRPCGYVRRPFSAHDLIRVMHDLMSGVQVAHRQTGDTDGCSPVARSYCDRERPATESAA